MTTPAKLICDQCKTEAVGMASHTGRFHKACYRNSQYDPGTQCDVLSNQRPKGLGVPYTGCGKWRAG